MDNQTNPDRYADAVHFLYDRLNFERTIQMPYTKAELKLDRMIRLLQLLGNPQDAQRIIHVAGTKGKGSTCAMLSTILQQAGYRTGLYTSPHLLRVEERLAINGQPCSAGELVELVDLLRPAVQQLEQHASPGDGKGPTFFELTTALAFLHFARRQVDYTILEVGLGGRLDSTNVCHPIVSVITSISYDHMRQLGSTLEAIAREKAGIIKPSAPVISGVTQAGPAQVIAEVARQNASPLRKLGEDFDFAYVAPICDRPESCRPKMHYYRCAHGQRNSELPEISLGLLGMHQAANGAVALATCDCLREQGVALEEEHLRSGLQRVSSSARIQVLRWNPTVLLDTAHNDASIEALLNVIRSSFPQQPRRLVFATTRGKDVTGMLRRLIQHFDQIICTRYLSNPRSVPSRELFRRARRLATESRRTIDLREFPTPREAWQAAQQQAGPQDLICLTGSFFIAAEMLAIINAEPQPVRD